MNVKDLVLAIDEYSKTKPIKRINVCGAASLYDVVFDSESIFDGDMLISVFTEEKRFVGVLRVPLDSYINLVNNDNSYSIFISPSSPDDERFFVFDNIPKEIVDKFKKEDEEGEHDSKNL